MFLAIGGTPMLSAALSSKYGLILKIAILTVPALLGILGVGCSSPSNAPQPSTTTPKTYTTTFPLTENPISEGGNWVNGHADGVFWSDVQTTGGVKAWGTQVDNGGSGSYADSIAALKGTWGTNQSVTVVSALQPGVTNEIEIHLHTTISANNIQTYEFNCSLGYQQIGKWFGPPNQFGAVGPPNNSVGCPAGVTFKATAVTNANGSVTLTAYINGVQVNQATDVNTGGIPPYTGGSPGLGFWIEIGRAHV